MPKLTIENLMADAKDMKRMARYADRFVPQDASVAQAMQGFADIREAINSAYSDFMATDVRDLDPDYSSAERELWDARQALENDRRELKNEKSVKKGERDTWWIGELKTRIADNKADVERLEAELIN